MTVGCIGMPPIGACAASDVNCDGVIDADDADAVSCGISGGLATCCQPPFGTAITYQGNLFAGGLPVTSTCDFEFELWDDAAAGGTIGPLMAMTLPVTNGVFSADLYFGRGAMDGNQRFLEIAVACPSGGAMTLLTPRTQLRPAPYSIRAGTGIGDASGVNLTARSRVGIGTSVPDPDHKLTVDGNGAAAAAFNRTSTDGVIVSLMQDGIVEGTITVAGAVVAYTAFTGAHLAWTLETMQQGDLVTLTGVNRRLHGDSEIVYGISASTKANDPACLGTYLGLQEPSQAAGQDNPHLVMAVGNGSMWVTDTGRNIAPGDYLISSDIAGHAMLDDPQRFSLGYVVARAGEPVEWAKVPDSEVFAGRKHQKISVLFESFERGSTAGLQGAIAELQQRIDDLDKQVREISASRTRSSLTMVGILGAGFGAATLGRRAFGRRTANGGPR
jgi:hypothetical protein